MAACSKGYTSMQLLLVPHVKQLKYGMEDSLASLHM